MSLQTFLIHFHKALCAVKPLDHYYEEELDNDEAKIFFFYFFPQDHIWDYLFHGHHDFDAESLEDLNNFFKAIMMQIPSRNSIIVMTKAKHPQQKKGW